MDWITIDEEPRDSKKKTRTWLVREKARGYQLGRIAWFGRWRKYAFNPFLQTVFEEKCLRDIADFCERQTREHRRSAVAPALPALF